MKKNFSRKIIFTDIELISFEINNHKKKCGIQNVASLENEYFVALLRQGKQDTNRCPFTINNELVIGKLNQVESDIIIKQLIP